jgi:NADPH:quinone reductase-like Zn-dependent oxidoreductase
VQAVHVTAHGDPTVLEVVDLPEPVPGPGEVLVRVLAVSINHLDLFVRRGMPGFPIPFPRIPGCDGIGEIAALGEGVADIQVGRKVVIEPGYTKGSSREVDAGLDHLAADYGIRGEHSDGLDRELVVLERRYVFPLPAGVDPIEGAAVPLVFLTAWGMLITRAGLAQGESVLVIAGTSGVGSAAIQIARERGARVFSTAGTDEKRALARELGAEQCFDHTDPDWGKQARAASGGQGFDVVVEHVGPATWDTSMRVLGRLGRLVTCGGTTGPSVKITLPHLFIKQQSVLGSTMGPRGALPIIFDHVARGAYKPVVDRVLPLSKVREAHTLLEERKVHGKLVMTPGS